MDAAARTAWRTEVLGHLEEFLGPAGESFGGGDGVELRAFGPSHARPWITVATVGMSEVPITGTSKERARQELLVYLPPDWEITGAGPERPADWWPMQLLRDLVDLRRREQVAFKTGECHTVETPPRPLAPGTVLTTALLNRPGREEREHPEFADLEIDAKPVRFLWVIPITTAEANLVTTKSYDALLDLMAERRLPYEINAGRACMVTGRAPAPTGPPPGPAPAPTAEAMPEAPDAVAVPTAPQPREAPEPEKRRRGLFRKA